MVQTRVFHVPKHTFSHAAFFYNGTTNSINFFDSGHQLQSLALNLYWNKPSWITNASTAIGRATKGNVHAKQSNISWLSRFQDSRSHLFFLTCFLMIHLELSLGVPLSTVESIFHMLVRTLPWLWCERKRQLGRSPAESLGRLGSMI